MLDFAASCPLSHRYDFPFDIINGFLKCTSGVNVHQGGEAAEEA